MPRVGQNETFKDKDGSPGQKLYLSPLHNNNSVDEWDFSFNHLSDPPLPMLTGILSKVIDHGADRYVKGISSSISAAFKFQNSSERLDQTLQRNEY
uniref:Uncharacterized protein n=1 Tax=Kalanchoe fedtschenkoi TaxID=63787 RepID=A0A7N0SX54_KALFE